MEGDALLLGLLHIPGVGRHLGPRAAVEDGHPLRPQPPGHHRRVHGHVPAADDDDPPAHRHLLPQIHPAQEVHPVEHSLQILAGNAQPAALVGPHGDEDGIIIAPQFLQARPAVPAHGRVESDLHPQGLDIRDLPPQHVFRQAVLGDAHGHHPPGHGQGLENGDRIALAGQEIGGGEAGRPRTDDGNARICESADRRIAPRPSPLTMIRHEPLEVPDGDGLVVLAAPALALAGMVADAAADAGEGDGLADEGQGLLKFALGDKGHVTLDVDASGAGDFAGGRPALFDGENAGHGAAGLVDGLRSV